VRLPKKQKITVLRRLSFPIVKISRSPRPLRAFILGLAFFLSGCEGSNIHKVFFEDDFRAPNCPEVSILADAANLTRFREGPGRDLTDSLYQSQIKSVDSSCKYIFDEDTGEGRFVLRIIPTIDISRGPANKNGRAVFDYFVSLTSASRDVLSKQSFPIRAEFRGNRTHLRFSDIPVFVDIPTDPQNKNTAYHLFVGFQLSRNELDYNRKKRALSR
jgi:hypothetical protein